MEESVKKFKFIIPASWTVSGDIKVFATSLEDAIHQANEADLSEFNSDYVDGSFDIDEDVVKQYLVNKVAEELCTVEDTPEKDLPLLIGSLETNKARKYLEEKIKGESDNG
jgi:hypothetical protein